MDGDWVNEMGERVVIYVWKAGAVYRAKEDLNSYDRL